jgi:hypothetical protein
VSISNWSDTNYLSNSLGSTPNNFTLMAWFYFSSVAAAGICFQFNYGGSSGTLDLEFAAAGAMKIWTGSALADVALTLVANKWVHIALTGTAVNGGTLIPYLDGIAGTSQTGALTASTTPRYYVGRDIATGESIAAASRVSDLKIWQNGTGVLSAADIKRERTAYSFLTQRGLYSWMPCFHGGYAGRDLSGKGNHFTVNGSFTTAQEPPAIVRPKRFRVPFGKVAAAGGGAAAAQNLLPLIGVG